MGKNYLHTPIVSLLLLGLLLSAKGAKTFTYKKGEAVTVKECDRAGVCRVVFEAGGGASETILLGLLMVRFETGSFTMGSLEDEKGRDGDEGPVEVTFNRPFEIGKYEVTQRQWFAMMGNNPSYFRERKYCRNDYAELKNTTGEKVKICPNHPVEKVSWDDTREFFRRLNERAGNAEKCGENPMARSCWRLPTEAEWEYAAKGGAAARYFNRDNKDKPDPYVWYWKNSEQQTQKVGMKKAGPKGLHDMHGNVWEWTMDMYGSELPGGHDPLQTEGKYRAVRGGGWYSNVHHLRSANRNGYWGDRSDTLGFRAVRGL